MQSNKSHLAQQNYQAIIELMQAYDCSYEQAQRHFQILRMSKQTNASLNNHSFRETQKFQQDQFIDQFEVLDTDTIIPFTPKEYRALKLFFSGNMHYSKKKANLSFCQKFTAKFKDLRRKIKCLKYLNPKRLWRVIRRKRETSNYNRLTNQESSQSQNVKVDHQRWFQVDEDWMDQLQQHFIQLTNYLNSHKILLRQVNALAREGVKTTIPENMDLPPSLQPYLFIRERTAQLFASNVKQAVQKTFKVICLDNRQFNLLHKQIQNLQEKSLFSLAFVNIFEEVQILKTYSKTSEFDIEKGQRIFKHFLIKNRLFKSIVDREMGEFAFTFQQPQLDYESSDEEDEVRKKQNQTHQSIIKEQDMLYQSMLSSYASKEEQKEKVDMTQLQYQRRREEVKLSIREEPTASSQTFHIVFRTPTGQTLTRNFHKQDTLQYVKNWIFCQDQIEFQNATSSFDLYHGYPPTLVQTKPNEALWSIFGEQQNKLRLIIKEN